MNAGAMNPNPIGLNDEFFNDLEPGERIVWATRPSPRAYARGTWVILLFAIPWTAFSLFWIVGSAWMLRGGPEVGTPFGLYFPLFGVPFLLIGGVLLDDPDDCASAGRESRLCDHQQTPRSSRKPTLFGAITVETFLPERLTAMTRTERSDGSGDLVFETFVTRSGSGTSTTRRGFLGLGDVRDAERMIVSTLLQNRTRPL